MEITFFKKQKLFMTQPNISLKILYTFIIELKNFYKILKIERFF